MYHSFGQCTAAMIQKKTARCFLRCPSAYAAETAATDFSVAKRVCPSREEGVYGKTQFYTDVKATQCQGKNILYHKPRKTGKSLCHLPHRRQQGVHRRARARRPQLCGRSGRRHSHRLRRAHGLLQSPDARQQMLHFSKNVICLSHQSVCQSRLSLGK